jgi:hypothetical protein
VSTKVSEENIAYIFRVQELAGQTTSVKAGGEQQLVFCSAYASTMKIEAICSSETSVDFQRTTWPYIPDKITILSFMEANKLLSKVVGFVVKDLRKLTNLSNSHTNALMWISMPGGNE